MKRIFTLMAITLFLSTATLASATTYNMYENFTNRDGAVTWLTDPMSSEALMQPYDFTTSKTWTTTFNTEGPHYFGVFVDAEIDQAINTFFNENGVAPVTNVDSRLSWEMGDPFLGTIWNSAQGTVLSNTNTVGSAPVDTDGDGIVDNNDVSMALMWNFTLDAHQKATLHFSLSDALPTSGFYLEQYDPDSNASFYFSSTLTIENTDPNPVPEPSTFVLLGSALAGLGIYARKRRNS